jgi:hypothetical protein
MEALIEILKKEYFALALIGLNITFNMYAMKAEKGIYPMGTFFYKKAGIIEAFNWTFSLGLICYLSYYYTWYFLLSFFVFPVLGSVFASLFMGNTQLIYLLGFPILLVLFLISKIG